jgi:hypothetical protein
MARLILIAALVLSLLFAPAARAEPQVKCMEGITAARSHCDALVAQADALREVLANAPAGYPVIPIMDSCMRGLSANLPGYDYNTYFNTCSQLLTAVQRH